MATTSPTAVIYARISRDREGAGLGVDRQEADCRELAARLGLTITEVYVDNDLSAYSGKPRPDYRRMCADLDRPDAPTTVLCWHTDRLHRSPRELEDWITLAQRRAVVVRTVRAGEIDLATPTGRAVARTVGAWARQESEHKSDRIKRKMIEIRDDGRWHGGIAPFGWAPAGPGRLALVADESALVVRGTRMILDGRSIGAVVRAFTASGLPPRRAQRWTRASVVIILSRWSNAGLVTHDGQPVGPATWPALANLNPIEVCPDAITPDVISADDVRAVRAVLADNAAHRRGPGTRARWLLAGIARCPCGAVVRSAAAGTGERRRSVYRCDDGGRAGSRGHTARNAQPCDDLVRDLIAARLRLPDLADLLDQGPGADLDALRAEVTTLTDRLESLAVLLGDGTLDPAGYRTAAGRVRDRLGPAEAALSASLRRSPLAPVLGAPDPGAAFLAADLDVARAVVRELVTVTLCRPRPGNRFDLDSVQIDWRT